MNSLQNAIQSVIRDCLALRSSENVFVLADDPMNALGVYFYQEVKKHSAQTSFLVVPSLVKNHSEIHTSVAGLMKRSHASILITSRSMAKTRLRRIPLENGVRVVGLPGLTTESIVRTLSAPCKEMVDKSRKIADIFTIGKTATLTNPNGTRLSFSISRMKGYADNGLVHEPGGFADLPSGQGSVAPVQGSANGTLVIDGSFSELGLLDKPVHITVRDGAAVRISGDQEARRIQALLRPHGRKSRIVLEIGIGTNPKAKLTGLIPEDQKVMGIAHVVLGNSLLWNGRNNARCTFDGVILSPTLVIDRKTVVENGVLQV